MPMTSREIENALRRAIERENSRSIVQARNKKNTAKYMSAIKAEKNLKIKPLSPRLKRRPSPSPVTKLRQNAFRSAVKRPVKPNLRRYVLLKTQALRVYNKSRKHLSAN